MTRAGWSLLSSSAKFFYSKEMRFPENELTFFSGFFISRLGGFLFLVLGCARGFSV